jgi:hypothetical protein
MMRHSSQPAIWTVAIILLFAGGSSGQVSVRVNEAAARLQIQGESTLIKMTVSLPIENLTSQALPARVVVELVGARDAIQSSANRDVTLPRSATTLKIPLPPLSSARGGYQDDPLPWCRLRYAITPTLAGGMQGKSAQGIISVSEITPQLFDLHVAGPPSVKEGGHYALRVRTIHPLTGRPVAGVAVQASLDINSDNDKPLVTRKVLTDREGFAALAFALPNTLDSGDEDEIDVNRNFHFQFWDSP